jgi:hypothetical protein
MRHVYISIPRRKGYQGPFSSETGACQIECPDFENSRFDRPGRPGFGTGARQIERPDFENSRFTEFGLWGRFKAVRLQSGFDSNLPPRVRMRLGATLLSSCLRHNVIVLCSFSEIGETIVCSVTLSFFRSGITFVKILNARYNAKDLLRRRLQEILVRFGPRLILIL